MLIHKIKPSVNYNQWLKRLDTQLNEPTNQNSIINSPMSPSSLISSVKKVFELKPKSKKKNKLLIILCLGIL